MATGQQHVLFKAQNVGSPFCILLAHKIEVAGLFRYQSAELDSALWLRPTCGIAHSYVPSSL